MKSEAKSTRPKKETNPIRPFVFIFVFIFSLSAQRERVLTWDEWSIIQQTKRNTCEIRRTHKLGVSIGSNVDFMMPPAPVDAVVDSLAPNSIVPRLF